MFKIVSSQKLLASQLGGYFLVVGLVGAISMWLELDQFSLGFFERIFWWAGLILAFAYVCCAASLTWLLRRRLVLYFVLGGALLWFSGLAGMRLVGRKPDNAIPIVLFLMFPAGFAFHQIRKIDPPRASLDLDFSS